MTAIKASLFITLSLLTAMTAVAKPLEVIVAPAVEREIADPIEALGTLRANETAVITATLTDTISEIRFDDGQRVKGGDLLVALTNREQLAELEAVEAEVREAERQFERVQDLADRGQESRALLDQRRRELETARARLRAVDARLSDRLIKAPFDGIVDLRSVSVGSLLTPGAPITTLIDDSVMKLDFPVPELYLDQVRTGLIVRAGSRAFPDQTFTGEVVSISNQVDPVTRAFQVRAEIPNPERRLRPGMLMTVTLDSAPRQSLMVPEEGLSSSGRRHFVMLIEDGEGQAVVRRREVEIGVRRPGEVEIISGLARGDQVVIHGGFRLSDGDQVSIRAVAEGDRSLADILANRSAG
ncbi:MAG: efflux RND transporter periplasmic adaptor subunit [Wenzhouxiangella sp.]